MQTKTQGTKIMYTTWNKQNGTFTRDRSQIQNETLMYTKGADAAENHVNHLGNLWDDAYSTEEYENGWCDTLAEARRLQNQK